MPKDRKSPLSRALLPAIVVHIVVVVLLIISFNTQHAITPSLGNSPEPVKAKVIDGQAIEKEKQRREDEKQRKLQEENERKLAEEKRKLEEAKKQEEQRLAEIQRKKEEEQRIAEVERKKEQERIAEEKRKKQEEAERLEKEKKKQEEAKRRAQEKRKQEEAEQKRIEDALKAEEEELAAAERRAQAAARKRELSRLTEQYIGAIVSKVQGEWRKPMDGNYTGASCKVFVEQAPGGYITDVRVQSCTGGDESLRRSVKEAVLKSDPLPEPPKEELFDRQIRFTFRP